MHHVAGDAIGVGRDHGVPVRKPELDIARGYVLHDVGPRGVGEGDVKSVVLEESLFNGLIQRGVVRDGSTVDLEGDRSKFT